MPSPPMLPKSKLFLAGLTAFFFLVWTLVINSGTLFAAEVISDDVTNWATVGAPAETPTPQPSPSCGKDEHLDLTGTKCLKWEYGGPPTPPPGEPPDAAFPAPKPEIIFSIYGYGPAGSEIKMTGIGISETSQIDPNGYFEFINPPFPTFLAYLAGNYYPELCFQAQDSKGRLSMPVCIPPLSKKAFTENVGPVILPPTISLSDGVSIKETQLTASGSTLPNTDVDIFVAKKSKSNMFELVGEVSAFYLPAYKVKSDSLGNFEFSLPTSASDEWKIFASSIFQGSRSPKSNTLTYYIKPVSYRLIEIYEDALAKIKPALLTLIIGLEFFILLILIFLFSGNKKEYVTSGKHGNLRELQKRYTDIQQEYLNLLKSKSAQM
jgi:hypothetical protein